MRALSLLVFPIALLAACDEPVYMDPPTLDDTTDVEAAPEDPADAPGTHGEYLEGMSGLEIPAGEFMMGAQRADDGGQQRPDETPHSVELTGDFLMGETEVTRAQFEAYMGYDPTYETSMMACADCPVHSVSWSEAAAFSNAMSAVHDLEACYTCEGEGADVSCLPAMNPYECAGYRLPTEAEWEFAANAGEDFVYPGSDDVDAVGWWQENSDWAIWEVGLLAPNAWGLYDMGGNIREFVNDWHVDQTADAQVDPWVGPDEGAFPVEKGGSFACIAEHLEPNTRYMHMNGGPEPTDFVRDMHVGFRVARGLR